MDVSNKIEMIDTKTPNAIMASKRTEIVNADTFARNAKSLLTVLLLSLLLISGAIWTLFEAIDATVPTESEYFTALTFEGFYFAAAILVRYFRHPIYMFEPYVMITVVYILVYHVAAVFQLTAGETARYGVDSTKYALIGCTFVVLGHIAFSVAYGLESNSGSKKRNKAFYKDVKKEHTIIKAAYIIYFISLALYLAYQLSRGFSLSYVLSGGLASQGQLAVNDSPLSFLSYCSYSLISAWFLIYMFGRNRTIKLATGFMMLGIVFFGGSRAPLLIPLLACAALHYIRKNSSPALTNVLALISALVLIFAVMQVARVGIRTGAGLDMQGVDMAGLFEPFYAEIDDFKVYYGVFAIVPNLHPLLFGRQMILGSLTLFIPRAIWPGKPQPMIYEIINLLYGQKAVLDGVAYPNLSEYYVEFGFAGIIVCMFILGLLCRYCRGLFTEGGKSSLALALYCVIFPALFQVIIRGYMPQNFSMIVFLLAPIIIVELLNKGNCEKPNELLRNNRRYRTR